MDHVWRLMGGKDYKELLLPSDAVNTCPLCYANFQLFEETVETAQEDWKVYAKHFQVPKDVHSVKAINYATLELTTKKNDYFGIHAGERVFVRILNVESSSKSIGGLNYYDFATLVQDIVKVMLDPSNEEATGTVLKWFEN
ncbi:unnamed protein product [Symbiodinium necroappetens]|uniref:Uncharacterized protein n=1 Tax=Symbiodinium necroappetens TaxID=1628268 RepID=A0A812PL04_9DINO|nr:unnamed protein product [Symbiodinium necroappetens]